MEGGGSWGAAVQEAGTFCGAARPTRVTALPVGCDMCYPLFAGTQISDTTVGTRMWLRPGGEAAATTFSLTTPLRTGERMALYCGPNWAPRTQSLLGGAPPAHPGSFLSVPDPNLSSSAALMNEIVFPE